MNLQTYLLHSDMRRNTTFRILPTGKCVYVVDGREIHIKEFEAAYPIPIRIRADKKTGQPMNIDGSKSFLFDD